MQKALFQGVKFCPVCGCNIQTVNRALELSMPTMRSEDEPEPPPRLERPRPPIGLQPRPKSIQRPKPPRSSKIGETKKNEARQLRAEGKTPDEIASLTGINRNSLPKIIYGPQNMAIIKEMKDSLNGVSHE